MAYQEREAEQRRIVVDTPNERREDIHTEARRYPESSSGISGAALAAIVLGVIALAAIIILFVLNQQQNSVNANVAEQQPPVAQQPAQQPPVIVQQPATQPPVIINGQPAPANSGGITSSGGTIGNMPEDSGVQAAVDKKLNNDPQLSSLGITASVIDGKVTLIGVVHNQAEKAQVERVVRSVKGVKSVDNQITVG